MGLKNINSNYAIPSIIKQISLKDIQRVDVAIEGDWNSTSITIWTPINKSIDFDTILLNHPTKKPSLEIIFSDSWLGVNCYFRSKSKNFFNKDLALQIIEYIEGEIDIID